MELLRIQPTGRPLIEAYGSGGFRVSGLRAEGPLLLLRDRVLPWPVSASVTRLPESWLTEDALAPLLASLPEAELALVGTGPAPVHLPATLRAAFKARGLVLEAMSTPSACRTFNILQAEDRRVVAALLPMP